MANTHNNPELLSQDIFYQNNYYFTEPDFDHKDYDYRSHHEPHYQYTAEMFIPQKKNKFINHTPELNSPATHYLQKNILNQSPCNVMSLAGSHLEQHFDDHELYIMFKQENLFPNSRAHHNSYSQKKRVNNLSSVSTKLDFTEWSMPNQKSCKKDSSNQIPLAKQFQEEKNFTKDTGSSSKNNKRSNTKCEQQFDNAASNKRNSKGLRNLSETVRQIVDQCKITTYKQVADKLIQKLEIENKISPNSKDEQNVKRRVYDALNVLISADILKKQGKNVMTDTRQNNNKSNQKQSYRQQIKKLQDKMKVAKLNITTKYERMLILQNKYHAISNLISRNKELIKIKQNNSVIKNRKINFPFIGAIFQKHTLDKNISITKNSVGLKFTQPFRLMGDIDALLKLNIKMKNFKSKLPIQILEYNCDILEQKQQEEAVQNYNRQR